MKKYCLLISIFISLNCLPQSINICFNGGFMNDSIRVEAVYLGDNKSENEVFNKSVTTIGSFHILSENCFEVNFESYPRVFLKFYINEEFKGGVQVDKKSDNKIRHIYVSNLFDGLVFNFSGKSKLR